MPAHRHPSTRPRPPLPEDPGARAAAVADARAVLEAGWPAWAARQGLDPLPALQCAEPRVSVVGAYAEQFHLVAVIRFCFEVEGRTLHGLARGPRDDGLFEVRHTVGPAQPAPRAWWRRGWPDRKRLR